MPLNQIGTNYGLTKITHSINQVGLHAADPGLGLGPAPGEQSMGNGNTGYFREPHMLPLMFWGGISDTFRNAYPFTWSIPRACTLLYVTFWKHIPSYYGYTYFGSPEPLDAYVGFAPIGGSLFGVGTVTTSGIITSPKHGLVDGDLVRLDPALNDPLPGNYLRGLRYTVERVDDNRFRLISNARQLVTLSGNPTGGTFTLTYDGHPTDPVGYNPALHEWETSMFDLGPRLDALPNVNPGDLLVSGGPAVLGGVPGPGKPWIVTWSGDLKAISVPLLTADVSGLTGGTSPAIEVRTLEEGGLVIVPPATGTLFWHLVTPITLPAAGGLTLHPGTIVLSAKGY